MYRVNDLPERCLEPFGTFTLFIMIIFYFFFSPYAFFFSVVRPRLRRIRVLFCFFKIVFFSGASPGNVTERPDCRGQARQCVPGPTGRPSIGRGHFSPSPLRFEIYFPANPAGECFEKKKFYSFPRQFTCTPTRPYALFRVRIGIRRAVRDAFGRNSLVVSQIVLKNRRLRR